MVDTNVACKFNVDVVVGAGVGPRVVVVGGAVVVPIV